VKSVRLCLVGFNRNLHETVPALVECFSRSLSGIKSVQIQEIILVFSCKRTEVEDLFKLASQISLRYGAEEILRTTVLEENDVDAQISSIRRKAMKAGDPWPKTNYVALGRSIHQLQLQSLAFRQFSRPVDYTLFARADLAAPPELALGKYQRHSDDFVVLPNWHSWGGINDRFAIVPKIFEADYFGRIKRAEEFMTEFGPLHAETFLKYCLKDVPTLEIVGEKFRRTRVGGLVKREFRYAEVLSRRMVWVRLLAFVKLFKKER